MPYDGYQPMNVAAMPFEWDAKAFQAIVEHAITAQGRTRTEVFHSAGGLHRTWIKHPRQHGVGSVMSVIETLGLRRSEVLRQCLRPVPAPAPLPGKQRQQRGPGGQKRP